MANISTVFEENNVFQGPAVVYLGAYNPSVAVGEGTPEEIGGVFEVSLDTSFDVVELKLGWPKVLMKQYIKEKMVTVKFRTVEPGDYELLQYALGSAYYSTPTAATTHQIDFGEDNTQYECSIMLTCVNVEGKTETVKIWRAIGGAETVTRDYDDEDIHKPQYTFKVLRSTQDWSTNALAERERFYRMIFETA